jgi:hypothetical protein
MKPPPPAPGSPGWLVEALEAIAEALPEFEDAADPTGAEFRELLLCKREEFQGHLRHLLEQN